MTLFIIYLVAAGILLPILLIRWATSKLKDMEFDYKDALVILVLLLFLL